MGYGALVRSLFQVRVSLAGSETDCTVVFDYVSGEVGIEGKEDIKT